MKFMISYTVRREGQSFEQNAGNSKTLIQAFSKWRPEDGLKVHAFVATLTTASGYVLVEAEDAKAVSSFVSKFGFWNAIQVEPVIDVAESVGIAQEGLAWATAAAG